MKFTKFDARPLSLLPKEQANAAGTLNDQRQLGIELGMHHAAQDMQALFLAYERACLDPNAKIPTPLHLAIATLKRKYDAS